MQTVGAGSAAGLSGTIDEISYIIDPNQHTAVIKGYVENPGKHIRAGQYVTATVNIPPPDDVVEIPSMPWWTTASRAWCSCSPMRPSTSLRCGAST